MYLYEHVCILELKRYLEKDNIFNFHVHLHENGVFSKEHFTMLKSLLQEAQTYEHNSRYYYYD